MVTPSSASSRLVGVSASAKPVEQHRARSPCQNPHGPAGSEMPMPTSKSRQTTAGDAEQPTANDLQPGAVRPARWRWRRRAASRRRRSPGTGSRSRSRAAPPTRMPSSAASPGDVVCSETSHTPMSRRPRTTVSTRTTNSRRRRPPTGRWPGRRCCRRCRAGPPATRTATREHQQHRARRSMVASAVRPVVSMSSCSASSSPTRSPRTLIGVRALSCGGHRSFTTSPSPRSAMTSSTRA